MSDDTILGAAFGQLGQTVKQGVKQVVKLPEEMAKDAGGQIGSAGENANENKASENKLTQQWQSDEDRIKFLQDLYGKSDMSDDRSLNLNKNVNPSGKKPTEFEGQIKDKSLDEQKKLIELRNQLHKENYYDPTFNPPRKQEERPQEKIEKEEKEKKQMEALQIEEQKKKELPITVKQGTHEKVPGISG